MADAAKGKVVYKPCGAGGGDIGIALANDERELAAFIELAVTKAFQHLQMTMDPRGVRRVREAN